MLQKDRVLLVDAALRCKLLSKRHLFYFKRATECIQLMMLQ